MKPAYDKIGFLTERPDGAILLCLKRKGTHLLILPGGCLEDGESAMECLSRELREELGPVQARDIEYLGTYTHRAAGEPEKTVRIELYRGALDGEPHAASEIAELVWFSPEDDWQRLSPSLSEAILPDLLARGILAWPRR